MIMLLGCCIMYFMTNCCASTFNSHLLAVTSYKPTITRHAPPGLYAGEWVAENRWASRVIKNIKQRR